MNNSKEMVKIAVFSALVFLATYFLKIQHPYGYIHLGDSLIFISVLVLGYKNALFSAGIGAGFADLIAGYSNYVLPTIIIKCLMVLVIGLFIEKIMKNKRFNWVIGLFFGGVTQVIGYSIVGAIFYGLPSIVSSIPLDIIQSLGGIIITFILVPILDKTSVFKLLKGI